MTNPIYVSRKTAGGTTFQHGFVPNWLTSITAAAVLVTVLVWCAVGIYEAVKLVG